MRRSLCGLAALAPLGILPALWVPGMAQEAAKPSAEAAEVAGRVTARANWMRDAAQCPTQLMAAKEAPDVYSRNDCQAGSLSRCMDRCATRTPGACYWLAQEMLAQGEDGAADALFQRACKLGVPSGCTNRAASMTVTGPDKRNAQQRAGQHLRGRHLRGHVQGRRPLGLHHAGPAPQPRHGREAGQGAGVEGAGGGAVVQVRAGG